MKSDRIPGLSAADRAALDVLMACHRDTNEAVQELARAIALQPDKPRRRRRRYGHIIRHARGHLTADVVMNTETGQTRRFGS